MISPPTNATFAAAVGVMITLTAASRSAAGREIIRGAPSGPSPTVNADSRASAQAAGIGMRVQDTLARTAQTLAAIQAMQTAARKVAQSRAGNPGADPNHPGKLLPSVADGLISGGLVPDAGLATGGRANPVSTWLGAGTPIQTTAKGKTSVTITQTKQQAILNWQSFNIGKNTTLSFDQSAGGNHANQWIVFNKISDLDGVPSQVLGSIKAAGQVYVINQNGIIFGGGSQVNVHTLVASSLPINENLISRGLLNNPDAQFLFSALALNAGSHGTPAFTPNRANTPNGNCGNVVVQSGAKISSPASADHVGGRVALIGPTVTNAGTISTPDGQAILAAGLQVGFAAHANNDPTLRGLDVYVGTVSDSHLTGDSLAGTVTNAGIIDAPRANVILAGKALTQLGAIRCTTTVSLNGRIDLSANYNAVSNSSYDPVNYPNIPPFLFQSAGVVTLGPKSVTQILPEAWSPAGVVNSQWTAASRSQINIQGQAVHAASNATLQAPNADIHIDAGTWNYLLSGGHAQSTFLYSAGQIYLDAGAAIDVAGSENVAASVTDNIVSLQLRGPELADSPTQRNGVLRGMTVAVDISQTGSYEGKTWVGTPLADVSGYVALIKHPVAQLTVSGGSVSLKAGESVVMQAGSKIDVSGGWINYEGGTIQTTKLLSGGRLYDISKAGPDQVYDGIYTGVTTVSHSKWNTTETYKDRLLSASAYDPGYIQGGSAGSISITAPGMALDGKLYGNTVMGPRQRGNVPASGALSLTFEKQDATTLLQTSPAPPNIVFQSGGIQIAAEAFSLDSFGNPKSLRTDRYAQVLLSPNLFKENGFGTLNVVNDDGNILVPARVAITTPPSGAITLSAANIDIEGKITAPGGLLNLTVHDYSSYSLSVLGHTTGAQTPLPDSTRGLFTLGAAASLSTAGYLVDDRITSSTAESLPLVAKGGLVSILSYSANLKKGSAIDTSGGIVVTSDNRRTYGNAGTISIKTGQDPLLTSLLGGHLWLKSSLSAYAGLDAAGGKLSIQAPLIQIGGATRNPGTLLLSPAFFTEGGFREFELIGLGSANPRANPAVLIAPHTIIAPKSESWLENASAIGISQTFTYLPQGLRTPVSLTFSAPGITDYFTNLLSVRGDILLSENASIKTDARASVSFSGNTVALLGAVTAPGGAITISGGADSTRLFADQDHALPTVDLGPKSRLSTAGAMLVINDPSGNRTGSVLSGGKISVTGNIVADAGGVIDVSGASGTIDLAPSYADASFSSRESLARLLSTPTHIDSDGGSISLAGKQELFADATVVGRAGGPSAQGGSLSISSGRFIPPDSGTSQTPLDITTVVTQSGRSIPTSTRLPGQTLIGNPVLDTNKQIVPGLGYFAADTFASSGCTSLALTGVVRFSGPVTISARRSLTVATGGILYGDSTIKLSAPYVALGTVFQPPQDPTQIQSPFRFQSSAFPVTPTYGPGALTVKASLIDIGNLSLQNIGNASFLARGGDIRGNGIFDIAGAVALTSGQIYPPTATSFTIAAYDYSSGRASQYGSVTLWASGRRAPPLSAGGLLNVFGSVIHQAGVLRAPCGGINLGWNGIGAEPIDILTGQAFVATRHLTLSAGSVTSVSSIDPATGHGLTIPFGLNLNEISWIDPSGRNITKLGPPSKTIVISAMRVDDRPGSTIDIRGGGDLYAYRWVNGTGGTKDILGSTTSFAVLPGYEANYAPFAPFNPSPVDPSNFGGDNGYILGGLSTGDRVHLEASHGLSAGTYTLLPARYALLPGAFLVTPKTGVPTGTLPLTDGADLVAGYRVNTLDASRVGTPLLSRFEVASSPVVNARAEYDGYFANRFFRQSTLENSVMPVPVPIDSGQLVLEASRSMTLRGSVLSRAPIGGRGGWIDISSPLDIAIAVPGATAKSDSLLLDPATLNAFRAESLLIGGIRQIGPNGTSVTVSTNNITVDNAGAPLKGTDIIIVANESLTLASGAQIEQSPASLKSANTIVLGQSTVAGSGDGVLLRVSSAAAADTKREGVAGSPIPTMTTGPGVRISGKSITLDSTYATSLSPNTRLIGSSVSLNSGQISVELDDPGPLRKTAGLVLSGETMRTLQSNVQALALQSYSTIDIYGTGRIGLLNSVGVPTMASIALQAGLIRNFNNAGGRVTFSARTIALGNSLGGDGIEPFLPPAGALQFNAGTITLGANQIRIDQVASVSLNATSAIFAKDTGSLLTQGAMILTTPLLTGATAVDHTIESAGVLILQPSGGHSHPAVTSGLGARLTLQGSGIVVNSDILLPSGELTLHAVSGDISIGGHLSEGGTKQQFFELDRYTKGGAIRILSDFGNVNLAPGSTVSIAAASGGGNAGELSISAPNGAIALSGGLFGQGATGGVFSLDVTSLPGGGTASLDAILNAGGFSQSRTFRIRNGDVRIDGKAMAHTYNVSADHGSITVSGIIDASGSEGGAINLEAFRNITLAAGSLLTVKGQDFNAAGKGGSISLETRGDSGGIIDIRAGSILDLAVAASTSSSADNGEFTGTLHLRAPQSFGNADVQVGTIGGAILNASSIVVEGFKVYTPANGSIDSLKSAILSNGNTWLGSAGTTTPGYSAIVNRLLGAGNSAYASLLSVEPGAEIVNPKGDLTLSGNWDLSTYRFGPNSAPGILTLRAAGNLNFNFKASLSDGFDGSTGALWQAPLLAPGSKSWSFRLVAGADFTAADFRNVQPLTSLGTNTGSLLLGRNSPLLPTAANTARQKIIPTYYQTIRTGSGDIDIYAGRDVLLLNSLATIYTAGIQATPMENFDLPDPNYRSTFLGATQSPAYSAQYSYGGGNLAISAQNDIARYNVVNGAKGIEYRPDSTRELPANWLYRRGYVDLSTGQFTATHAGGEIESTSWWVDFSNFYEGVGALGGGNVSLTAGHNIANVDAVLPTNARMPKGTPNVANLRELGGGDMLVRAGHDIDGGVYYVERGHGTLIAENSIHSNSTRAALTQYDLNTFAVAETVPDSTTWLPTTLFLGKGGFDVRARGDLLLGPVANPFLLPQGINNSFYDKTYFSTYSASDFVNVTSLTGSVILRDNANGGSGSLESWLQNVLLYYGNPHSFSWSQPWLRLDETSVAPFATVSALMPPTLRATAFSGDISISGNVTLTPSPIGTVDLFAEGSIHGLQANALDPVSNNYEWGAALINLSDADPNRIPVIGSPLSLPAPATGFQGGAWNFTAVYLLNGIDALFSESGSVQGSQSILQTKLALHSPNILHSHDTNPVHLYAASGDISGVTLFSGKASRVAAGRDITDIAFYIQNTNERDISIVSAGRDLNAYNPNSLLREAAQTPGNLLSLDGTPVAPLAGDIQIDGPGAIEVLAGRNLDLGIGSNRPDGTGVGIVSMGNERNPFLPAHGANIIAAAGIGISRGLDFSQLSFTNFISQFLNPAAGGTESNRYLPELGTWLGLSNARKSAVWNAFNQLPSDRRDALTLDIFYRVLRDAGRDHNAPSSAGYHNYDAGLKAIAALFPGNRWSGDISLTSREIKTASGGNIALFAPGGQLTVGFDIGSNQSADQGILTEAGGNISIFTRNNVTVGTSRIFTLRGGDEIIWSSLGNIAAGAASRTVQSAPPTRVLIDPQSGDVKSDLAGLATGGGIGVLETLAGAPPGNVDLIAPRGTIDAGDAGIRVSGNLNLSAVTVLNADNIQVRGISTGAPATVAPNLGFGVVAAASNPAGAVSAAAVERAPSPPNQSQPPPVEMPSIIDVEVIGYGGADATEDIGTDRSQ